MSFVTNHRNGARQHKFHKVVRLRSGSREDTDGVLRSLPPVFRGREHHHQCPLESSNNRVRTSGGADPPNANISLRSLAFFMLALRISSTALKSFDKVFHLEPRILTTAKACVKWFWLSPLLPCRTISCKTLISLQGEGRMGGGGGKGFAGNDKQEKQRGWRELEEAR